MGRKELGAQTSLETAELAGKQLVEGHAWKGIQYNVSRGLAGGAQAVPHGAHSTKHTTTGIKSKTTPSMELHPL
ncbi:MAG: hypothetical protein U0103_03800 [Candidatus Obscuribacterales bacterium]